MYDGVPTHGVLHEARLHDVFRQRMTIMYEMVFTVVMAILAKGDDRDRVVEQLRRLAETMFPEDTGKREEREAFLAKVLREEGMKEYKVKALFER